MRYVQKDFHCEIHPESDEDLEELKRDYPHLWPFVFVCTFEKKQELAKCLKS